MKKYLLISHYNWDGDWGLGRTYIFNSEEEACVKKAELIGLSIKDIENDGDKVVIATDKDNEYLEEEYQKLKGCDLFYLEDFGQSAIIAKYGWSSTNHEEWTIQEIEV